jgi:hypothetical protein
MGGLLEEFLAASKKDKTIDIYVGSDFKWCSKYDA